jgi:hypothetical protein
MNPEAFLRANRKGGPSTMDRPSGAKLSSPKARAGEHARLSLMWVVSAHRVPEFLEDQIIFGKPQRIHQGRQQANSLSRRPTVPNEISNSPALLGDAVLNLDHVLLSKLNVVDFTNEPKQLLTT